MRPVDPAAGSRRRALKAGLALLAAAGSGCLADTPRRAEAALEPLFVVSGGRLITRVDIGGNAMPGDLGQYVPLVFPVAAVASFNDIYIADAGVSRLYRYDRALDALAVMPEPRIGTATRLQTGPDGSIYVLDPFASEIRRYTRGGRPLPSLPPRLGTSRYAAFAVDPLTGKVYAVDSAHLFVDEIQPLGQLSIEFERLGEAGPVAADGRGLFVADVSCGCVVEWVGGRAGRRFGAGKLHRPLALAVDDRHQIYAVGADRSIALVHEEGVEFIAPAALGLQMPESIATAPGMILVADGAGHRVAAFRRGRRSR